MCVCGVRACVRACVWKELHGRGFGVGGCWHVPNWPCARKIYEVGSGRTRSFLTCG